MALLIAIIRSKTAHQLVINFIPYNIIIARKN